MKINAVAVSTSDMKRTIEFYSILGFDFTDVDQTQDHAEPITPDGSARLMIDKKELIESIIGEIPKPGNHSGFAIEYENPTEIDEVSKKLLSSGFNVNKEPWDAFWGQRYCIVEDPDGYKVDLYAQL